MYCFNPPLSLSLPQLDGLKKKKEFVSCGCCAPLQNGKNESYIFECVRLTHKRAMCLFIYLCARACVCVCTQKQILNLRAREKVKKREDSLLFFPSFFFLFPFLSFFPGKLFSLSGPKKKISKRRRTPLSLPSAKLFLFSRRTSR